MTSYDENYTNPVLFGPRPQSHTFGESSRAGCANCAWPNREIRARDVFLQRRPRRAVRGEDRELIPSIARSRRTIWRRRCARERSPSARSKTSRRAPRRDRDELRQRRHGRTHRHMGGHHSSAGDARPSLERLGRRHARRGRLSRSPPTTATPKRSSTRRATSLTAHTTNPVPFVLVSDAAVGTWKPGGAGRHRADAVAPVWAAGAARNDRQNLLAAAKRRHETQEARRGRRPAARARGRDARRGDRARLGLRRRAARPDRRRAAVL